ncbi:unnamed protein product [Lepeophtheirus salmonis]|uniref:(salmon louse) hypothetical protein n=1 Tax=Lepeophtheirus salmonis TaxID=72036 RepID=A0A7R8CDF9_LEPSM|nr:unnamed protein product [Lepeophtheirus salmonis]CAF2774069.1 unnamed protein product [Lepeophtheirus salmonis]
MSYINETLTPMHKFSTDVLGGKDSDSCDIEPISEDKKDDLRQLLEMHEKNLGMENPLIKDEYVIPIELPIVETSHHSRLCDAHFEERMFRRRPQILRLKASYKVARLSLQQRCNFISKKAKCLSTNEDKVKKFLNDDQIKFLSLKLRFTCGLSGYSTLIDQGYPLPSIRTLQRAFADNVLAIDVLDENDKMSETTSKKVEEL